MEAILKFLFGWVKDGLVGGLAAFASFDRTVDALLKEMGELRAVRLDVERRVDKAETEQQLQRTGEVEEWLVRVEAVDQRVKAMEGEFNKWSGCACLCSCSPAEWWSGYQLAGRAAGYLEEVKYLKRRRGELGDLAEEAPQPAVVEMPVSSPVVGQGLGFKQVLDYIGGDEVGIIGIYGGEGIGKTILLKRINNRFAVDACRFDRVIFVEISNKLDVDRIQSEIGERIGLPLQGDRGAKALAKALSRRTFLLLLDDVPPELDFSGIGIPFPTHKSRCKIVLTAREEQVCVNMGAHKRVKLDNLDDDEAWKLFCATVGSNETLHSPEVELHARTVVKNCRGLPLAIVTMGRAMATKRSLSEWERASAGREVPEKVLALVGPPCPTACSPLNASSQRDVSEAPVGLPSPTTCAPVNTSSQSVVSEADIPCKSPDGYEKQQENEDLLIRCIEQPLGFTVGIPTAACLIYKCVSRWGKLEADQTSIFDRVIQRVATAIEGQEDRATLVYWLSNVFTLLSLIHHAVGNDEDRTVRSTSLFGRMNRFYRKPLQVVTTGEDRACQVKAKTPVLLFKRQLIEYAGMIYGMVRDSMKKELYPLLSLILQAPRLSRSSLLRESRAKTRSNAASNEALLRHWHEIVNGLENFLKTMRDNYVPPVLVQKMFAQIFWFINVQLFNSLLLRRECCSFSHGEFINAGLHELESWCAKATDEFAGSAWDELKHVRQAASFLVKHQKPKMTFKQLVEDLCPILSVQQLYRIGTMYWDDKYGTHSISSEVVSTLRIVMTEDSNNSISGSFLLDDDSSFPFSFVELSKLMEQINVPNIEPPPHLREDSGFMHLFRDSN